MMSKYSLYKTAAAGVMAAGLVVSMAACGSSGDSEESSSASQSGSALACPPKAVRSTT